VWRGAKDENPLTTHSMFFFTASSAARADENNDLPNMDDDDEAEVDDVDVAVVGAGEGFVAGGLGKACS